MRYALLSDVHANLEALEVVLDDIASRQPDRMVCLGDFVGYGPDPVACVDRLRPALAGAVVGNHDLAALGQVNIDVFNPWARMAILWTREQLTEPIRQYLHGLPQRITPDGFLAVHGSVRDPVEEYIFDLPTAQASFEAAPFSLCVVGHTHVPAVFVQNGDEVSAGPLLADRPLQLEPGQRYIINVGSVGQPRDGDPRTAYVWLDEDARTTTLIRLPYPLERTQQKMLAAGLPPVLAERLTYGR